MNNLAKMVKIQGRTIPWLSKNSGLSYYKIHESMKGNRPLKINEAQILAKLLQIPPEFFWDKELLLDSNHNVSKTPPEAPGADK